MRIQIRHVTTYRYEGQRGHAVQALRLTPPESPGQSLVSWQITAPGIESAAAYTDAFGNRVHLAASRLGVDTLEVAAAGVVDTTDTGGVVGFTPEAVSADVFLRQTAVTSASPAMRMMAEAASGDDPLTTLHALMNAVHSKVAYDTTASVSNTTAAHAYDARRGVCQDHAHILAGAARFLGIPARYVSGYLVLDDAADTPDAAAAHHAWVEALVPDLGWVGFDAANFLCPTDRYVRLTCGLDAASAAPIRGVRRGVGAESMLVEVRVADMGR